MIYGQDEPMLFPVADLYDSGMMQMYINAAREQYNQARDDMKEFSKLYGDFFSPFSKDMEWVDAQTRGRVNDALTYMQANGIDPLRSAEGRALVAKIIRDTNVAGINQRRANAKMAEEYIKNRGTMIANGTYNPDYENYLLGQMGLGRFEDFDSSMGAWTRTSPAKYQDLNAATSSWFDDLKGEDLGLDPTGRYRMFGVNEDQLQRSMSPMLPGFVHTDLGGYYYELAKKQLQAEGNAAPSEDEVLNRLRSGIVGANKEKMYTKYDTDDYAKMQQQHNYSIAEDKAKTANDLYAYEQKKIIDRKYADNTDGSGKSTKNGKQQKGNEEFSYTLSLLDAGIQNFSGSSNPGYDGLRKASEIGKGVGNLKDDSEVTRYMNRFYMMDDAEDPSVFAARFSGDARRDSDNNIGAVKINPTYDRRRLKTQQYVEDNTYGVKTTPVNSNRSRVYNRERELDKIVNSPNAEMRGTGRVWTSPTKDGSYVQYVEVEISNGQDKTKALYEVYRTKRVPSITKSTSTKDKNGKQKTTLTRVFAAPSGFDIMGDAGEATRAGAVDVKLNEYFKAGAPGYKNGAITEIDVNKQ